MKKLNPLKIEGITKSFDSFEGTKKVLKNVSFEVLEGQCTVISGENGSGKSLLMSIISGLENSDSGKVTLYSKPGLVFQEAETQILGETPREDISYGPKNLGWGKEKIERTVSIALEKTGLTEKADMPARFLSGGEKRKLAVACMLAMDFPIIILDEPYANLDYRGVKQVNELIVNLKKERKTLIIVTHELEKCLALAEKLIILHKGEVVFNDIPEKGLEADLESWNIRNPIITYKELKDLVW